MRLPPGDLAIVSGSGLALVPEGAEVIDEIDYADLGWPATCVAGHPTACCWRAGRPTGARALRVLLACGRPHLYEGWSAAELARPVDDLAGPGPAWSAAHQRRRELSTRPSRRAARWSSRRSSTCRVEPGDEAPVLPVTGAAEARRLAAALGPGLAARPGGYVAVPGPHYETPAEAAWLRRYGEVVGMSTAAEVRAAARHGLPVRVLSLVTNVSGAALDHAEVLAAGALLAEGLGRGLGALAAAFMAELEARAGRPRTGSAGRRREHRRGQRHHRPQARRR